MHKKTLTVNEIFFLALQNHKNNNFQTAKKLYKETLILSPKHVDANNNLGILYNQLKEHRKAVKYYEKVIQIQPNFISAYNNLGNTLNELREHRKAIKFYEKVIKLQPYHVDAHYNLGNTFKELGEHRNALACYEKAILIQPNHIDTLNNLGILYHKLSDYKKSLIFFEKVIQINPQSADGYNNIANIYKELQEYTKAINCYEKAIQIKPDHYDAYNNLANTFYEIENYEKAISNYKNAIQFHPNHIDAHNNLGNVFKELGDHKQASICYEKALKINPDNLITHWLNMNLFPVIYDNYEEISYYKKRFKNYIEKINQLLDLKTHYSKEHLIKALSSATNFYLHYQGEDVLELQKNYAFLIERITKNIYPNLNKKEINPIPLKEIKIGFVSSFFKNHTITKEFKNWIINLDKKTFKKFVYYCDNKFDHITKKIKDNCDYFFSHTDVEQLINKICRDKLDVIIYLDIGMMPKIQILSSLRLALLQFNSWGHPVTSGFSNIDYFLSGELMENQDSQKNYSEKLIKLPNLGINYDFPNLSKIKKPTIPKKLGSTIFLNLQSLFKLLPQDDHIYIDIIKKYPNCHFWFIEDKKNPITTIFKKRLTRFFQNAGYSFNEYCYFHQRCSEDEFFGLIDESDIILDSLNWSGGNTSLEAISLNKPIVSCPSNFMRGRHTSAILKILGIDETIASSKKKYIEIAVKLARDKEFRDIIINKIKTHKKKLFNDDSSTRYIEDTIKKIYKFLD